MRNFFTIITAVVSLVPSGVASAQADPVPVLWLIEADHFSQVVGSGFNTFYVGDSSFPAPLVDSWEWDSTIDHSFGTASAGSSRIIGSLENDRLVLEYETNFSTSAAGTGPGGERVFFFNSNLEFVLRPYVPLSNAFEVHIEHQVLDQTGNYQITRVGSGSIVGDASTHPTIPRFTVDGVEYSTAFRPFDTNWGKFNIEESGIFLGESSSARGRIIITAQNLTIPEPGAIALLAPGLFWVLQRRRR
ncbi:MAG: hypothetical protein AAF911_10350 [Planctomycetota bacterium]